MKKVYLLISSLFISSALQAQENKNVGIGTVYPDKSAVLDIHSSNKGLLIPRLTQEQMTRITNPATGLLVFKNEFSNSGFFYFNGEKWSPLSNGGANAIATMDMNGWALTGNVTEVSGVKAAATAASFIGTPSTVPINFKVGSNNAGRIDPYSKGGVFFGTNSGASITTGTNNVGLGTFTLNAMTMGASNLALGNSAIQRNVSGSFNIAIGALALKNGLSNSYNLAIGSLSLENATGSYNTAIGSLAGQNTAGDKNTFIGYSAGQAETGSNKLYLANSNTTMPLIYGDFSAKFVSIGDVPVDKRNTVASSGAYSLIVEKGILSEKLKVALKTTADWADYVFEQDYKDNMMTLEEVEAFALKNKHLPNVPSAADLVDKGLDFNETSRMFMEKIEELTLYLIELNKEVKLLKSENEKLKTSLSKEIK